nr:T-box protein 41 [Ipomoea batatas]
MGFNTLSPIKFAFFFSLSFAIASPSISDTAFFPNFSIRKLNLRRFSSLLPSPEPAVPKATPADLLALLGTKQQASAIDAREAQELRACLKFLVPFVPRYESSQAWSALGLELSGSEGRQEENELVWWPPEPVMELARLAVDSGGDPGSIHWALDPTVIPVPDVEGSKKNRCELTRTPYGRHFINEEINSYLKFLFEMIVSRGPEVGLNVSLNRYDLFHGHLFLATDSRRLGILFHAKEYPAYDEKVFPVNMGYCQIGSNVTYDDSINLRNILWLAPLPSESTKEWLAPGVLVVLDAHPDGVIYRDLIPEYVNFVRTLYEDDFGQAVVDVNYLNVGIGAPEFQLFIC